VAFCDTEPDSFFPLDAGRHPRGRQLTVGLVGRGGPSPGDGLEAAMLRERCGKLLKPTDFYPIRYQVESFPSEAEIEAIRASSPA
jgi:hypothetical protein